MTKKLYGVVFASAADDEYDGLAHVWMRDANTAYWFSLSRAVESDSIEVMVSNQLNCCDEVCVTLSKTGILVRLSDAAAQSLDGHREYAIEFHPESMGIAEIRETLEVIFSGKSGLLLNV